MDWDFREDSGMGEEWNKGEEVGNDRAYVHRRQRACRYAYGLKYFFMSCEDWVGPEGGEYHMEN